MGSLQIVIKIKFSGLNPLGFKEGPKFSDCIYKRKEREVYNRDTQRGRPCDDGGRDQVIGDKIRREP